MSSHFEKNENTGGNGYKYVSILVTYAAAGGDIHADPFDLLICGGSVGFHDR